MIKKIGVLLIVLVMIATACVLWKEISAKNKIVKKIEDFYGNGIEIVSVEYSFKLSDKEHAHYTVLAKKRNSEMEFSVNPDTMLNGYTCVYWKTWMQKQATVLIRNNLSENAYCPKIILLGESLLNHPEQKVMDYEEYMTNHVEFDTKIMYKIQDNFSDVEENVDNFLAVLVNSDLIFDIVYLDFGDGVELRYSYEDIVSMVNNEDGSGVMN